MLLPLAVLIAVGCGVREHWSRLHRDDPAWNALLRKWFLQGAVIPAAAWAIANLGVTARFPALIPRIAIAQGTHQPWASFWMDSVVVGAGFVVICWGSVTYLWM